MGESLFPGVITGEPFFHTSALLNVSVPAWAVEKQRLEPFFGAHAKRLYFPDSREKCLLFFLAA